MSGDDGQSRRPSGGQADEPSLEHPSGDVGSHARVSRPSVEMSIPATRAAHDLNTVDAQPAHADLTKTQVARHARGDASAPRPPARSRLELVAMIGQGGMGEVHRARDHALQRQLAMKVLHVQLSKVRRMRERFLDEAQVTAQLAHPSIPPVHEAGELEDGRPYFTMKEVHGRTLTELLTEGGDSFREARRIEVFQRVCEAMAYAHARGVIHCDLKPMNVMVGSFGEVMVMDWGVARIVPQPEGAELPPVEMPVDDAAISEVAGTPAYMPPEQAIGDVARLGPPSDVYALGVMLYELLSGQRPYQGALPTLLYLSTQGEVPPLIKRPGSIVDDSLYEIIVKAMRPDPADRYPDAGALAEDIARWREGATRREKALAIVREARERLPALAPDRERAEALRAHARAKLAVLGPSATAADKRAAWALEDEAAACEHAVGLATAEIEQLLQGALAHAPELPEARALLAELAYQRHRRAEARRDEEAAAFYEVQLRGYDLGEYVDYLAGTARLSLATEVPARARLSKHVLRDRQLVPEFVADLGTTPITDHVLPVGSYLVEIEADGRPTVRYPVVLRRRSGWDGARPAGLWSEDGDGTAVSTGSFIVRAPGATTLTPIELPIAGAIGVDEALVPAGYAELGGDPDAGEGATRQWIETFVIQRDPVTFREMARFLADPAGARFRAQVLRDGLGLFRPDWPAIGVSWHAASAYATWLSQRTGQAWRLPMELEWEKAARGVDGRLFPWGDFGDGALCHVRTPERAPSAPRGVSDTSTDVSPYGMRGAAGNVREWCADPYVGPGVSSERVSRRVVRGGSFRLPLQAARLTTRAGLPGDRGHVDVGFRLVRSLAKRR
jgi:serine/threonine-protein kinase